MSYDRNPPARERFFPDKVLPPEVRELTFAIAWLVGTREVKS